MRLELIGDRRQPEVHDADLAVTVDHDVRGLEVTMQHAFRMRRCESGAQLARDLDALVDRQSADSLQQGGEIFTVDILHRQIQVAVRLTDVVHAADVRMRQLSREPHLGAQPGTGAFIGAKCRQELQGDRLTELEIVRAVDFAHPAAPEARHDAKAVGEERPCTKASFVGAATVGWRAT